MPKSHVCAGLLCHARANFENFQPLRLSKVFNFNGSITECCQMNLSTKDEDFGVSQAWVGLCLKKSIFLGPAPF